MVKWVERANGVLVLLSRVAEELAARGYPEEVTQQVVTALEPTFLTVYEVAEKYGLSVGTLHSYVQRGCLHIVERRKNPGTRPLTVIDEAEVIELLRNPPRPGRPRKVPQETP